MTGLSLALANLKPGTGKTTSAVWLAHVFAQAGNSVLLVDADPSGSALEWSDLAAMDPRLAVPRAITILQPPTGVVLTSRGDTLVAIQMERLVRSRGLVTYVPRLCASK